MKLHVFAYAAVLSLYLTMHVDIAFGAEKPNVMFIVSDDLNCYLGCYGHEVVQTPNIDRLADRGVLFERAYCQFPVCNASRASFMTGRRPDETRVYDNGTHFRKALPDVVTMPQMFRKNGYFVARVGKIYHYGVPRGIGTDGRDDPPSWEYKVNPKGRDVADEDKIFSLVPAQFGGTLSWLSADGDDSEQTDAIGASAAIELMRKKRDRPFFLAVGFYRPHTPYVATHAWFRKYPLRKMTPPFVPAGDRGDMSPLAYFYGHEQEEMTDRLKREARQAYAASISFMDAQVGRLLDALEDSNLSQNTIVVFTSDHGYHMGEHGYWQKESLNEESARVPLIVSVPKMKTAGGRTKAICEMIDIYPTLADLCKLDAPRNLSGVSVVPQMNDLKKTGKPYAMTQAVRYKGRAVSSTRTMDRTVHGYSIRTDRYRFISWDSGNEGEEFYDHRTDPNEFNNLALDPAYEDDRLTLRQQLRKRSRLEQR